MKIFKMFTYAVWSLANIYSLTIFSCSCGGVIAHVIAFFTQNVITLIGKIIIIFVMLISLAIGYFGIHTFEKWKKRWWSVFIYIAIILFVMILVKFGNGVFCPIPCGAYPL